MNVNHLKITNNAIKLSIKCIQKVVVHYEREDSVNSVYNWFFKLFFYIIQTMDVMTNRNKINQQRCTYIMDEKKNNIILAHECIMDHPGVNGKQC